MAPVNGRFIFALILTLALLAGVGAFRTQLTTNSHHAGSSSIDSALRGARKLQKGTLPTRSRPALQAVPLAFEPNEGQSDSRVKFLAAGRGYKVRLSSSGAELILRKAAGMDPGSKRTQPDYSAGQHTAVLRIELEGANQNTQISAIDPVPGTSNYFLGNDPRRWRTNIPHFRAVKYHDVYRAIDLTYHGSEQGKLEFDLVIRPGARPDNIHLRFEGTDRLNINSKGDLVLHFDGGSELVAHRPISYQQIAGARRRNINGRYLVAGKSEVRFQTSLYDKSVPLIIDPVLTYSTYLGGAASDSGLAIAVDHAGNAYIAGDTGEELPTTGESSARSGLATRRGGEIRTSGSSEDPFPTTKGAFQTIPGGGEADAFVSKLSSSGGALIYSTFLGGDADERINGIAIDSAGNAYLTGTTSSANFPTTGGAFRRVIGGSQDAFVTKLNPSGSGLVYSTYLGGSADEQGVGIALDAAGNAYVTGETASADFPITPGVFQSALGGVPDAFVTKLNSAGTALLYSGFLGGDAADDGRGIAVDSAGHAFVAGATISANFPTTSRAFQTVLAGSGDAFVTEFDEGGKSLIFSTLLGGSSDDEAQAIALDGAGNTYVAGSTFSIDFPTTPGVFQPSFGGGFTDAFVSSLNPDGSALRYSSYLGGTNDDQARDIAVDAAGNVFVAGLTFSTNFPTTVGALQKVLDGPPDAFTTKINKSGSSLLYSSYLGGSGEDVANGVAVDQVGNSYFTGFTFSDDFPTTPAAFQTSIGGGSVGHSDVFVTKLSASPPDCRRAFASVPKLFPPNHRFVSEVVKGVVAPGPIRITVRSLRQDEPVRGGGDETCADGTGVGTSTARVRAERSGRGDGRVYSIGFVATDESGAICSGQVKVCVPHDHRSQSSCRDEGALYDSTHC